jgi:hypothetical protein
MPENTVPPGTLNIIRTKAARSTNPERFEKFALAGARGADLEPIGPVAEAGYRFGCRLAVAQRQRERHGSFGDFLFDLGRALAEAQPTYGQLQ